MPKPPPTPPEGETLARIAETLAHKMRNSLGSIQASADVLRRVLALPGEEGALLDVIRKDARRLSFMVGDLALYAGAPRLRSEAVSLPDAVADALDLVPVSDPQYRDVKLEVDVPENLPTPAADRDALTHLLLNLLTNAYDAVERRGAVAVRARAEPGAVRIEIADTGAGLDAAGLAGAFEPFRSTKRARPGLGLFAAKRLAEGMGGTIDLESTPGRGATARVRLPLANR